MHPLRNGNFRVLLLSRLLAGLSVGFFEVPVMWWLVESTGNAAIVASVALVGSLAYLVASPLGGVLADRVSKRGIGLSAYLIDATLTALAGWLLLQGMLLLPILLALLAITNLVTAVRSPALGALLPLLLPQESYQQANATMGLATTLAALASFGAAGAATALLGPAGALFTGSALLLGASLALLPLREPRVEAAASEQQGPGLLAGVQVLRESPLLASVVMTATLLNLILAPMSVLFAPYTFELGAGPGSYGLLASSIVVGQLVGLALLNVVTITRTLALMVGGTLAIAFGVLGLAVAPAVWVAALSGAALGLAASAMSVQLNVMFQSRIAPEVMGRAMGLFGALSLGAQPLGFAAAGALLTQFGIRTIFAGVGVLTALASTAWLRPGVRKGLAPTVEGGAKPA